MDSTDIVIVTDLPFWRRGKGSFNRIDDLVRNLSGRFNTDVYMPYSNTSVAHRKAFGEFKTDIPFAVFDRFGRVEISSPHRHIATFLKRVRNRTFGAHGNVNIPKHEVQAFLDFVLQRKPKCVIFEFLRMEPYARAMRQSNECSHIMRLIDTHDVQHKRAQDFLAAGLAFERVISREDEIRKLRSFDAVVAITDDDAAIFQEMVSDTIVLTAAHPVPVRQTISARPRTAPADVSVRYIVSGSPNRVSLPVFLGQTWPRAVTLANSKLRLEIVGNVSDDIKRQYYNNIDYMPRTARIHDLFIPPDIVVNPIIVGSGLKIKNLEALSFGKPLITTSAGAQGMPERSTTCALIVADSPDDIANAIVKLADDAELREAMSRDAICYINRHFSVEAVYSDLFRLLSSEAENSKPHRQSC